MENGSRTSFFFFFFDSKHFVINDGKELSCYIKLELISNKIRNIFHQKDRIYLQSDLEKSFFNPLRGKQIDYAHVYFKSTRGWSMYLTHSGLEEDSSKSGWK